MWYNKLKIYSLGLLIAAVVFGLSLLIVINSVSPDRGGNVILFYFLAAGLVFCLGSLAAFYLHRFFGQREFQNLYLKVSLREGVWLALILTLSLYLVRHSLFSWINAGLLLFTFIFFESYLLTKN